MSGRDFQNGDRRHRNSPLSGRRLIHRNSLSLTLFQDNGRAASRKPRINQNLIPGCCIEQIGHSGIGFQSEFCTDAPAVRSGNPLFSVHGVYGRIVVIRITWSQIGLQENISMNKEKARLETPHFSGVVRQIRRADRNLWNTEQNIQKLKHRRSHRSRTIPTYRNKPRFIRKTDVV